MEILDKINKMLEDSKYILLLEKDFDDEGSEPYSKEVWERATCFLFCNAKWLMDKNLPIYVPEILPGPGGSIDIYWKEEKFEALLNFPNDSRDFAHYYIDDYKNKKENRRFSQLSFRINLFEIGDGVYEV